MTCHHRPLPRRVPTGNAAAACPDRVFGIVAALVAAAAIFLLTAVERSGDDATPATVEPATTASTETTQAPVTAVPGPMSVLVAPDGSGDHTSLADALAAVGPGSTITLAAGEHLVDHTLIISGDLTIGGDATAPSVIAGTGADGGAVVQFTGDGRLVPSGVSVEYRGTTPADVVVASGGQIDITGGAVRGGVAAEGERAGDTGVDGPSDEELLVAGSGVRIEGDTVANDRSGAVHRQRPQRVRAARCIRRPRSRARSPARTSSATG